MKTITLNINDDIFDKFQWFLSHFSKDEVSMANEIDILKFDKNDFDYVSAEKMEELKKSSSDFKNAKKDDFVEYIL